MSPVSSQLKRNTNLSHKEQVFVREFLRDGNATRAATRAGYASGNRKSAAEIGCRLVKKSQVRRAIEVGRAKLLERINVKIEDVVDRLAAIAFADMGEVAEWDADGLRLLPSDEVDTRGIKSVTVFTTTATWFTKDGEEHTTTTVRSEVTMLDRLKALELLGKHLGMWPKHDVGPSTACDVVKVYRADDWARLP